MEQAYGTRLAVLAGHFMPDGMPGLAPQVQAQACAATYETAFARPAATDASFARPASRLLPRDERVYETARLYGDGVASEFEQAPRQLTAPPPLKPKLAPVLRAAAPQLSVAQPGNFFESVQGWAPVVHKIITPAARHTVFKLPGVRPEELRLRLEGRRLTLSGRRLTDLTLRAPKPEAGHMQTLAVERPDGLLGCLTRTLPTGVPCSWDRPTTTVQRGSFQLVWVLPEGGDLGGLSAWHADSQLFVSLPTLRRA